MRRVKMRLPPPPPIGDVSFQALYRKDTYDARTGDGWVLRITRYQPIRQKWDQPLLDEPLLLVHGWAQNRHCFTCGGFVKRLLWYGADVHLLELRGHGKSSRELQLDRARREGRKPPGDLDWGWDLDSYLLEDLPAAVAAVQRRHRAVAPHPAGPATNRPAPQPLPGARRPRPEQRPPAPPRRSAPPRTLDSSTDHTTADSSPANRCARRPTSTGRPAQLRRPVPVPPPDRRSLGEAAA
jgi:hypothetical protein